MYKSKCSYDRYTRVLRVFDCAMHVAKIFYISLDHGGSVGIRYGSPCPPMLIDGTCRHHSHLPWPSCHPFSFSCYPSCRQPAETSKEQGREKGVMRYVQVFHLPGLDFPFKSQHHLLLAFLILLFSCPAFEDAKWITKTKVRSLAAQNEHQRTQVKSFGSHLSIFSILAALVSLVGLSTLTTLVGFVCLSAFATFASLVGLSVLG